MEGYSFVEFFPGSSELSTAIENLPDGFACISALREENKIIDFLFTYINKSGAGYFNLSPKELVNKTLTQLLPKMRQHSLFNLLIKTVNTGTPFLIETPYEEKTSVTTIKGYFNVSGAPVQDKIFVSWRNISELNTANKQLNSLNSIQKQKAFKHGKTLSKKIEGEKRSESNASLIKQEYESVLLNSPDIIRRYDLNFRNIFINHSYLKTSENSETLIGNRPDEIRSGPIVDMWMDKLKQVKESENEIEFHFELDEEGIIKTYHTKMVPEKNEHGTLCSILAITRDISKIKIIQQQIEEKKKEFETLAENSTDLIRRFDKQLKHLYVNKFINIFNGNDPSFYIGKSIDDSGYQEESAAFWKSKITEVFEKGTELEIEYKYNTLAGEKFFHSTLVPERDTAGNVVSVLSIARDVTKIKSAEEELRTIKEMLTLAVEHFNFIFVIYSPDGRFIYANSYVKEISGFALTDILGKTNEDVLPFSITNKYMPALQKTIKTKTEQSLEISINILGKLIHIAISFLPVLNPKGELLQVVGIGQDITKRREVEKELRRSEERFRKAIHEAPIPIIMFDDTGKIIVVNKMWTHLSGYTINDIPNIKTWITKAFENGKSSIADVIEKIYHIEKPEPGGEYDLRTKSGDVVIWDFYNSPLGKIPGGRKTIISAAIDVTYRKRMEDALYKNELLFRSTFEQAAVGIAHVDLNGHWLKVNQRLCDIVGYTKQELLFTNIKAITHPNDFENDLDNIKLLLSGTLETYTLEKRYLHKNGTVIWINLTVSLVRDELNNPVYFINVIQDISDKKRAEKDLEQTIKALNESNQELQVFANVVSHDLREPMRMINWFSDFFVKKYRTRLDATAQGYITTIKNSAERANTMIKDLLEYTKTDKAKNKFTTFSSLKLLKSVLSDLSILIKENNAQVIYDKLPELYGDQLQIRQVFQNLISNAIKFRNSEDPIIKIKAEDKDSQWQLSIEDNGIGIAQEHYNEIFTIFSQLNDRDTYPGTGIGLAICKKNIERHNGRIWVESTPGFGSTFHILFPKKKVIPSKQV